MKASEVRIIGGKWRSRLIHFPDVLGLRPTPNRVRETLFNWLMQSIQGAVCVDAFSGSGALAFEALSRGAAKVFAFETNKEALKALQANKKKLQADDLEIIGSDFFSVQPLPQAQIIFLDPPFRQGLLPCTLMHLMRGGALNGASKSLTQIYFEVEKNFDFSSFPPDFEILKRQTAGEVCFGLCTRSC